MGKKRGEVGHAADRRLLSYYLIGSCAFKLQGMFTLFLMPSMLTTYLFYREKILLLLSVTFFLESYSNSPSFLTAVTLPCSHLSQKSISEWILLSLSYTYWEASCHRRKSQNWTYRYDYSPQHLPWSISTAQSLQFHFFVHMSLTLHSVCFPCHPSVISTKLPFFHPLPLGCMNYIEKRLSLFFILPKLQAYFLSHCLSLSIVLYIVRGAPLM